MPPTIWMQSQAALVEGFTNAVRHAHHHLANDTPIDIEVRLDRGVIELRIWDRGNEFDLKAFMQTQPDRVEVEAEGGRGLKLMIKIADRLEYIRLDDQRNCLYVIKRWEPQ